MQNKINDRHSKSSPICNHIVSIFLILTFFGTARADHVLKSPDGKVIIEFDLKDIGDQPSCPTYTVKYNDQLVIADSRLGFTIKDAAPLEAGFEIVAVSRTSHDSTYSPVYAERKIIRDNYNQLVVELKEIHQPYRRLRLTFRAYNEGAAFCYTLPQQDALKNFAI
jgi:alpha-glucosidase